MGLALRRILAILTWPVARPATLIWVRLLRPHLASLWNSVVGRLLAAGRAIQSRRRIRAARRAVRRREDLACSVQGSAPGRYGRPHLTRLVAALAALNVVLLVLLLRGQAAYRPPAEARLAASVTPVPIVTSPRARLPTTSPRPTATVVPPTLVADQSANAGSVAFVLRRDGNDDIYAVATGNGQPVRLTNDSADDRSPAWSPDGSRLAFASRRDGNWELYVLDVEDGSIGRLTWSLAFEGHPSWSPDGLWLAFESYEEENLDIYIMPIEGGERIRLTTSPAADYAPAWAPSGRHVAFVSARGSGPDIYVLALDDARDEAAVNISQSPDIDEDRPAWHPSGDYLAFAGAVGSQRFVHVQPMLNSLPRDESKVIGQGRDPAWAPGGNALVYVHQEGDSQFLLASAIGSWEAAPQVYRSEDPLCSPDWGGSALSHLQEDAESSHFSASATLATPRDPLLFNEVMADPIEGSAPFTLVTLDDIGAPGPYLNDRVDDSFVSLRQRVLDETGWDFLGVLDNLWEPLNAVPSPGVDPKSWNKAGRAFDFESDLNEGYQPPVEVVRELVGAKTWWRIYLRTERQDGSQGEPLRQVPWSFESRYSGNISDYENGGRAKASIPRGYYLDFTQLAADYGWQRVPAGNTWRTYFPATLFWHFEKRQGLDWEAAMLELYPEEELQDLMDTVYAEG